MQDVGVIETHGIQVTEQTVARYERFHHNTEDVGDDGKEHQRYPDGLLEMMR